MKGTMRQGSVNSRAVTQLCLPRQVPHPRPKPLHIILKRAHAHLAPRAQQPANAAVAAPVDAGGMALVEPGLANPTASGLIGPQRVEFLLGGVVRRFSATLALARSTYIMCNGPAGRRRPAPDWWRDSRVRGGKCILLGEFRSEIGCFVYSSCCVFSTIYGGG
jgi:hypothetical protein